MAPPDGAAAARRLWRIREDGAGLVHSLFVGLLFQELLDPGLGIKGKRMEEAQTRLLRVLPPPG